MSELQTNKRIREDSNNEINKFSNIDLKPLYNNIEIINTIKFDKFYNINKVKLFEINNEIVKSIKQGEDIKIVGSNDKNDSCLCTKTTTYQIKRVETSNSVFLIPPNVSNEFNISTKCDHYYELTPTIGKVEMISELLQSTQYKGKDYEVNIPSDKLITRKHLDNEIIASEAEINSALDKLLVIEINGYLRSISKPVVKEKTRLLLDSIIENDWDIGNINEELCLHNVDNVDEILLKASLSSLGHMIINGVWSLDKNKIIIESADSLFRSKADPYKLIPVNEFHSELDARTPGLKLNEITSDLLKGVVIYEEMNKSNGILVNSYRYLPIESMPVTAKERFEYLFQHRKKYTSNELDVYCYDLIGNVNQPRTLQELYLQYCRIVDNYYYSK